VGKTHVYLENELVTETEQAISFVASHKRLTAYAFVEPPRYDDALVGMCRRWLTCRSNSPIEEALLVVGTRLVLLELKSARFTGADTWLDDVALAVPTSEFRVCLKKKP